MPIIQIILVIVVVAAALFLLTYVSFHRNHEQDSDGGESNEECETNDNCNGDCMHCGIGAGKRK